MVYSLGRGRYTLGRWFWAKINKKDLLTPLKLFTQQSTLPESRLSRSSASNPSIPSLPARPGWPVTRFPPPSANCHHQLRLAPRSTWFGRLQAAHLLISFCPRDQSDICNTAEIAPPRPPRRCASDSARALVGERGRTSHQRCLAPRHVALALSLLLCQHGTMPMLSFA